MRCALAARGFINEDIRYNKRVIIDTMAEYADRADIVLFGEAFLQGFYAATFDPAHDAAVALTTDDPVIREIASAAKQHGTAASFGMIEKDGDAFFSSQLTIGADGQIIDVYRRVSEGWKEPFAGAQYREGDGFHAFTFMGKRIVTALCGDLWYDENVERVRQLQPDVVFWPVYTDFAAHVWNTSEKLEYAVQAAITGCRVLYVNSVCLDREGDEIACGGAALFDSGVIVSEVPSGGENVLIVEV